MATTATAMEHDVHDDQGNSWSGGKAPFRVSYGKLMMWYFLLSDAFTFAGFLISYGALRFSSATWPVPDFVFSTAPFGIHHAPLIFVTIMSFLLIISSVTMVRAVQEGHRENKRGVVFWMLLTIFGGLGFLSCQAWEWNNLIGTEHMTVTTNPFGSHTIHGEYLDNKDGEPYKEGEKRETFKDGDSYLIHKHHDEETGHSEWIQRRYVTEDGTMGKQEFGPKAFGALFFFITGFHGFHVLSGVAFLLIIMLNAASGLYVARKNGYEMVEKIGLYWHFVDLVWVFVFLVFYLL
ncbi:MAG: cytochrome c oxidase subunit 3 [Saprospiraceae bacterium]|nr:cytochrome c oxidase subunit 3 [Saprospiraceae bacterium]